MRILLVEDDKEFAEGMKDFFEHRGDEVTVARSPLAAALSLGLREQDDTLEIAEDVYPPFDVMLLDNGLLASTLGSSGVELLQKIQAAGVGSVLPPIVALNVDPNWRIRFPTAIGHLNKTVFDPKVWALQSPRQQIANTPETEYQKLQTTLAKHLSEQYETREI